MAKPTLKYERSLWRKGYLVVGVDEVGRGAIAGPVVASAVALVPDSHSDYRSSPPRAGENYSHSILNFSLCSKNIIKHNSFFWERLGIDDSKRLTVKRREELAKIIKKKALTYGIGEVGAGVINKIGISKATAMAMRKAIRKCLLQIKNTSVILGSEATPESDSGQARMTKKYDSGVVTRLGGFLPRMTDYFVLVDGYHVKYLPGGMKTQKAIVRGDQKSISIAAASIIAKVYRDHKMRLLDKKYPQYAFGRHKGYGTKKHREVILQFGSTYYHRERFLTTFLHLD